MPNEGDREIYTKSDEHRYQNPALNDKFVYAGIFQGEGRLPEHYPEIQLGKLPMSKDLAKAILAWQKVDYKIIDPKITELLKPFTPSFLGRALNTVLSLSRKK